MSNVAFVIMDFFFWGASWVFFTAMLALGVVGAAFSRKQKLGFTLLGVLIFYFVAKLGLDMLCLVRYLVLKDILYTSKRGNHFV